MARRLAATGRAALVANPYYRDLAAPQFADFAAFREAGAIASLNHPNFNWSITADEMRRIESLQLFEVYNGHPMVHNFGGGGTPGLEESYNFV